MSFDEAVKGTTRRIEVDNETACGPCKGTGAENSRLMTCAQCGGLGMVSQEPAA